MTCSRHSRARTRRFESRSDPSRSDEASGHRGMDRGRRSGRPTAGHGIPCSGSGCLRAATTATDQLVPVNTLVRRGGSEASGAWGTSHRNLLRSSPFSRRRSIKRRGVGPLLARLRGREWTAKRGLGRRVGHDLVGGIVCRQQGGSLPRDVRRRGLRAPTEREHRGCCSAPTRARCFAGRGCGRSFGRRPVRLPAATQPLVRAARYRHSRVLHWLQSRRR